MFYKGFGSKRPSESAGDGRPQPPLTEAPGDIGSLLNASGRMNLQVLEQLAATYERPKFVSFIKNPVLAGASIQAGAIALRQRSKSSDPNRTCLFEVASGAETEALSEVLKHAIYPLVKEPGTHRAQHIFTIGRVNGNDLIIPDIAISKRHAILELTQDRYTIRDCDSTNGTMLNGQRVTNSHRPIQDGDTISFARYEFLFLSPDSLYNRLTES